MLKITYLEDEIYLEYLEESIEAWKANRILVSLRAGVSIFAEESTACLVIPSDTPYLMGLAELKAKKQIEITPCDEGYLEVVISGIWITSNEDSEEGIFVFSLSHSSESFLYRIWQESQVSSSVVSE